MKRKTVKPLAALVLTIFILTLPLALMGCNSDAISQNPGEQKIVTRLCYPKNGSEPTQGIHNAMQGGKGSKNNEVPIYITTDANGKQHFKMSFDGYTNVFHEELIYPGRLPGDEVIDHSFTATSVIEPFEIRGEIDGEIEPFELKIHYTYQTATSGVIIDEDILLKGTGGFKWTKAVNNLDLHIHWAYTLNAPDYHGNMPKGNVERNEYYVFALPENMNGSQGTLGSQVDTKADKDAGETSVTIPKAIAIVIIGGGAAIAGAGAGRSGGDGGDNNGKKKSRYKMCLRKEFGDALRYDAQPVTIYARIVEINSKGDEIDRPDLTASLEIFSGENLTVEGNSLAGNYMGALISAQSAPGGQNPSEGVVSIKFSGEEGSFQNNVTFRLIGKPYISFPEQGSYLTMTLPMLLGDGENYETPFVLNDFLEKPVSVKLEVEEGVPLSCEIEEIEENQYLLKVNNNSSKPEGYQGIKQTFSIGIRAENEKELAEDSLNVDLYPEGLSIREIEFDQQGYALIDTFDDATTEEWGDVLPTGFVLDFVVPDEDGEGRRKVRAMKPEEFSPVFAGLKGTDERTTNLAQRFKYTIKEIESNLKEYKFAPQEALVEEEGKPYYLTLPISCSYGEKEYTLDLPVRLLGGGPGPLAGWDEALANMKKVVSKVGGISPELAQMLRENGKKMSTAELRLVTYRICHDAVIYYTQDAIEYEKIAAELDNMIYYAEWLKWFGDQAFSYLISTYYGNTADAILSPAKDIFASFLGEVIGQLVYGEKIYWEALEVGKNVNAAFDNYITNAFDDKMDKKVSFKEVCAIVGGFVVWKIAKNIYDNIDKDGKVDLYSAITATTSDLTAMGMKKIAGNFFNKALNSKAVQKNLNTTLGKWLQDLVPDTTLVKWSKDIKNKDVFKMVNFKKSDIFKKYLEEVFGMGMVTVTEMALETEGNLELSAWPQIDWTKVTAGENGQPEVYKISVNLGLESLGKLYDYLFEEIFGNVPFATEEKMPPIDPPFIPAENLA